MATTGTSGIDRLAGRLFVAVAVLGQGAFEVMMTFTTSPLARVEVVKVTPVAPATFVLFTCH